MSKYQCRHISTCDYCGPVLKRYLHEFSTETTPEDEALLAGLQTSTPKWQKEFVSRHVAPIAAENTKSVTWGRLRDFLSWPKLIAFSAATTALAVMVIVGMSRLRSEN